MQSGDLAIGRKFSATSTCGLRGPEQFCESVEAEDTSSLSSQSECFTCHAADPAHSHPAELLSDQGPAADNTWWQAEDGVHNVTLQLELASLFLFTHLVVRFRSPRPAAAVIERSRDFGQSYQPYQYYSNDCMRDFGMADRSSVHYIDEVICTSEYSNIEPTTNGEVNQHS